MAGVSVSGGRTHITIKGPQEQADAIAARGRDTIAPVAGLGEVEIRVAPFY